MITATMVASGGLSVSRRVPTPDHPLALHAPSLPAGMESATQRAHFVARRWRTIDVHWGEKVWLISLVTITFAQIVPGVDASPLQLGVGVAVVVGYSYFLRLRVARTGRSIESAVATFALLLATNAVWVYAAGLVLHGGGGRLQMFHALFFLTLLSLLVTMYDRWRPVCELRHAAEHHHQSRPAPALED